MKHVPGFIESGEELKSKGVDEILCISGKDFDFDFDFGFQTEFELNLSFIELLILEILYILYNNTLSTLKPRSLLVYPYLCKRN